MKQVAASRTATAKPATANLTIKQPGPTAGTTNQANMLALCSRHHHGKHEADWTPKRQPDGTVQWTSPTGHRYTDEPATYPTDRTIELLEPAEPEPAEPEPDPPEPPPPF